MEISQSRKAHRGLKRIGKSWMLVGNWFVKMASLKVETAEKSWHPGAWHLDIVEHAAENQPEPNEQGRELGDDEKTLVKTGAPWLSHQSTLWWTNIAMENDHF